MSRSRIFLLSPASAHGERARMVMRKEARFDLATRLRAPGGAQIGEVFAFLSGLYFRGKLTYAAAFGAAPAGVYPALVITPSRGLLRADTLIGHPEMREFAKVDVHPDEARYTRPLVRDAFNLARDAGDACDVVLLGSIATGKYVDILLEVFGERLLFPKAFVGRGDMSRGGLLLRAARDKQELEYVPVAGAVRHGERPPKLPRLR